MIVRFLAFLIAALTMPGMSAGEDLSQHAEEHPPQLVMPRPPQTPLLFRSAKGRSQQSLEVRYIRLGVIKFKFSKTGACKRIEQGTATIKPYWWLGLETDENEAGEAVAVQEYFFEKSSQCRISVRIDEWEWTQATVVEPPECSKECPAWEGPMHMQKQ